MKRISIPLFAMFVLATLLFNACTDIPTEALEFEGEPSTLVPAKRVATTAATPANAEILFGPERFLRGNGTPTTETRHVAGNDFEHFTEPFILHLRNGEQDGTNRVSSATVILDGVVLFGPDDFSPQVGGYDVEVALTQESVLEVIVGRQPGACPNDVLMSNFQTVPADGQFVDITNVGTSTINIDDCTLTAFNVFTERTLGDATVALSGSLAPGETFRVGSAGIADVDVVLADGALPSGPGALSLLDAPPPPDGTPVGAVLADNITGMVYLSSTMVFGVSHIREPSHNAIYGCIYGTAPPMVAPFTPVGDCLGAGKRGVAMPSVDLLTMMRQAQSGEGTAKAGSLAAHHALQGNASNPSSYIEIWIEGALKPGRAKVGASGGVVVSADGSVILEVPEEALTEQIILSVEANPESAPEEIRNLESINTVIELLPNGLQFALPVELTVPWPDDANSPEEVNIFHYDEELQEFYWEDHLSDSITRTVTASISHFTIFFVPEPDFSQRALRKNEDYVYKVIEDGFPNGVIEEAKRAIEAWEFYLEDVGIQFINEQDSDNPDIVIKLGSHVAFGKLCLDTEDSPLPLPRIRTCLFDEDGIAGKELFGPRVIILDRDKPWITTQTALSQLEESDNYSVFVLENIIQHEFGHVLGLPHWSDEVVMSENVVMARSGGGFPLALHPLDLLALSLEYDLDVNMLPAVGKMEPVYEGRQTSRPGTSVEIPPAVRVTTLTGSPVSKTTVIFRTFGSAQGGIITGGVATTGPDGVAQAVDWQLGPQAGEYSAFAFVLGQSDNLLEFFTALATNGGDGLVAYYPFNGNANDESGNSHDGQLLPVNNGPTPTADRFGNPNSAYSFDGVNDYIDVPLPSISSQAFSFCTWLKTSSLSNTQDTQSFFGGRTGFTTTLTLFATEWRDQSTLYAQVDGNVVDRPTIDSGVSVHDGQWHFVCITLSSSTFTLYLDGQVIGTDTAFDAGSGMTTLSILGAYSDNDNPIQHFFDGALDDVRIYNRVLSGNEVRALCDVPGICSGS